MSLQIGGVIFKNQQYKSCSHLITNKIMKLLIRPIQWKITHDGFKQDKWDIILPMMVRSTVEQLQLTTTYFPLILTTFTHISFPNLLQLNLEVNEIRSIQPLCCLNAPILQKLNLSNNRITSIKPLYKMNLKYLVVLALDGNQIHDFHPLTKVKFFKHLQRIILQRWDQRPTQATNLNWIFKINPLTIKSIDILYGMQQRFKDERSISMARKKYKGIQFK